MFPKKFQLIYESQITGAKLDAGHHQQTIS